MKIKFQFNVSLQKDAEEKKNTVTVNNSSFVDCARKEILNARERGLSARRQTTTLPSARFSPL